MGRLIDANTVVTIQVYDDMTEETDTKRMTIAEAIDEWSDEGCPPTVDGVEVVRCKDCYYCATEKSFDKEYLYCDAFYEHAEGDLIGVSLMVEPNHYCSWGERRQTDETD